MVDSSELMLVIGVYAVISAVLAVLICLAHRSQDFGDVTVRLNPKIPPPPKPKKIQKPKKD